MKLIKYLCITLLAFSFVSCGAVFGDDEYYDAKMNSEKRGHDISEELIGYINSKNAGGIKSMFSEKNKTENKDLDEKINQLFAIFPDGITDYEISDFVGGTASTESWSVNYNEETARIYLPELSKTNGNVEKMISIEYTHINHEKPDQVGVNLIRYADYSDENNEFELEIGCRW